MFGSGVRNEHGESGGFLKESVILCPANRQPGGIHEWRVRRARADVVLSEVRQALSRPVWCDQGVSRSNLSALPRGEQGRCVCLPSADEADAEVDTRGQGGHLGSLPFCGGQQVDDRYFTESHVNDRLPVLGVDASSAADPMTYSWRLNTAGLGDLANSFAAFPKGMLRNPFAYVHGRKDT